MIKLIQRLLKRQEAIVAPTMPTLHIPPVTEHDNVLLLSPIDDDEQIQKEIEYLRQVEARLVRLQNKTDSRLVRHNDV